MVLLLFPQINMNIKSRFLLLFFPHTKSITNFWLSLVKNEQLQIQFIKFSIKNMSGWNNDIKTEEIAKKQGKGSNQKSNFKYLMNSKTNRSIRGGNQGKENQIETVMMSARKSKGLTGRIKTPVENQDRLLVTVSGFQSNSCLNKCQDKLKTQNAESNRINTQSNSDSALVRESLLGVESNIQPKTLQMSCMTEECYNDKELLIKMGLLQKERDNLWNSIADIVKENDQLKETIAGYRLKLDNRETIGVQTQIEGESVEIQTDFTSQDFQKIQVEIQSNKLQIEEIKAFCQTIIGKQQDSNETSYSLKNSISETINLNVMTLTKQFQMEKQLLGQIHQQEIIDLSTKIEKCTNKISDFEEEIKEGVRVKNNMEKIYQKEIQEIRGLLKDKQVQFLRQIQRMEREIQQNCIKNERQSKVHLQYMQQINKNWIQKQRLYSSLLSQSHKTIKGLMCQMKEFQGLANLNHTKYLKSQRSQTVMRILTHR